MQEFELSRVVGFVEENIGSFHKDRLSSLEQLKLKRILQRKNPYLYKAKNILTAQDFVKSLLDSHLASQEETLFGTFLEKLAIFICHEVYGGQKSTTTGIDLEFERNGTRYIVSIKSGPNWGNSRQITKMKDDFSRAKRTLQTNSEYSNVAAVNGCCYGIDRNPQKDNYLKYCGKDFWTFISGNDRLFLDIVEPLGHKAKEKNEQFIQSYSQVVNKFTEEFIKEYCINGKIDWQAIVRLNSEFNQSVKRRKEK